MKTGGDQLKTSYNTLKAEVGQLKTSYNTLKVGGDELKTSYNTLKTEGDQLKSGYNTLKAEGDQLKTSYNTLKTGGDQLQTNYNTLKAEGNRLQISYNTLKAENDRLQTSYNTLKANNDQLKTNYNTLKAQEKCPMGWVDFNSKCYYISTEKKSWDDSRSDCIARGANLVIIKSLQEQNFLFTHNKRIWIGLSDKEHEGNWKWVDGTQLTTSYWAKGEPNDHHQQEDCAELNINFGAPLNWNDLPCNQKYHWVCKKEPGQDASPSQGTPSGTRAPDPLESRTQSNPLRHRTSPKS
uniref:C-type lectin domain-containing protein n=1 Tax=Scleropages formosus TaxID=113540 RepID=A0A8C9TZ47_SCLFO